MTRILTAASLALLSVLAGLFGYRVLESDVASSIYRERLADLGAEHDALIAQYNEAVKRSAVTELVVEDGSLRVVVRTIDGALREIPTPYDPEGEIYVDFAVVGGRLWVRRVFDAQTAPSAGVVVDPKIADLDWDAPGATFGKAVYRSLGEGRWVVTVSGDGSLALTRAPDDRPSDLEGAPAVRDYAEFERTLDEELEHITIGDVWDRLTGG
ncbi:MAG: hypothetical protein H6814_00075 [Phycisphaeraceae bacterium]|nr:hypothetical protein [Phycisphaeraceae bacterium]